MVVIMGLMLVTTAMISTTFLGILMTTTLASESFQIAKHDGCQQQCGNVSIPFPFGIGPTHCYLDKWFEIDCVDNSTVLLKQTHLEVLDISSSYFEFYSSYEQSFVESHEFDQWFIVKNPITFDKCTDKELRKPVNLTGTPFYYSSNQFVAVSCGVLATIESTSYTGDTGDSFSSVGCRSRCSNHSTTGPSSNVLCNGVDCCETYSPSIEAPKISFDNTTSSALDHDCKFAFLVDYYYWKEYKNTSTSYRAISSTGYFPVRLIWTLINHSYFDIFNTDIPQTPTKTSSFNCSLQSYDNDMDGSSTRSEMLFDEDGYSTNTDANDTLIRSCYCRNGFRGNPYLTDGCQDVNECDEHPQYCDSPRSFCVNTYGGYKCSDRKKFFVIGVGSALGALVLLFGTWGIFRFIKKIKDIKRKKKNFKRNGGRLLQQQISSDEKNLEKKLFSSNELQKASDNFNKDRILGHGGQGTVYKGMLEDGKIVAIKRSKVIDEAQLSEFINEVVILSQINHRNVVKLIGCCLETEVPLLVYEFIPNGTLSRYIHERNEESSCTWKMRLGIATEVAGALSYLHSAASFPIYHRDIKSTNILLDEKYRAKVADFGTSRTISLEQTHLTTLVNGTFGYFDPEYFQSGQFTEKSDVYSFGVVLVELLTGQKAISISRSEEGRNLATYFTMAMEEESLFSILDAQILEDGRKEEIVRVADIANKCLNLNGRNRPMMKEVAMALEGIRNSETATNKVHDQDHGELEYVRTQLTEPWDYTSRSTSSTLNSTAARTLFWQ